MSYFSTGLSVQKHCAKFQSFQFGRLITAVLSLNLSQIHNNLTEHDCVTLKNNPLSVSQPSLLKSTFKGFFWCILGLRASFPVSPLSKSWSGSSAHERFVICSSSCLFCSCSRSCEQRLRRERRRGRSSSDGQTTCFVWGTRCYRSHSRGSLPSQKTALLLCLT